MSNETKRDVFLQIAKENRDLRMYDPDAIEPKELIEQDYQDWIREYAAALPDDLPVIPKAIGEYIQERKAAHDSLAFALTSPLTPNEVYEWICTVTGDSDTELSQIEYVKQQDTFARAWVLGVWRVKKTGEIVKLEAEK